MGAPSLRALKARVDAAGSCMSETAGRRVHCNVFHSVYSRFQRSKTSLSIPSPPSTCMYLNFNTDGNGQRVYDKKQKRAKPKASSD